MKIVSQKTNMLIKEIIVGVSLTRIIYFPMSLVIPSTPLRFIKYIIYYRIDLRVSQKKCQKFSLKFSLQFLKNLF